jgi:hypothetical protein
LVSEVSKEIFQGKPTQRLSSNFLNFNSFVYFAVHNSKGADIGIVVTDGIVVSFGSDTVYSVSVCLIYDSSLLSNSYPILDFAERYEKNSMSTLVTRSNKRRPH